MGKCLITQLKSVVANPELELFNTLKVSYREDIATSNCRFNYAAGSNGMKIKVVGSAYIPYTGTTLTNQDYILDGSHTINIIGADSYIIVDASGFSEQVGIANLNTCGINKDMELLSQYTPMLLANLFSYGNIVDGEPTLSRYLELTHQYKDDCPIIIELTSKIITSLNRTNLISDVANINYSYLGELINLTILQLLDSEPNYNSIGAAMVANGRTSGTLNIHSVSGSGTISKNIVFNSSYNDGYIVTDN